uniref:Phospholipid/glycerol acyltransferase domain-containing protein n=1 Tax=Sciurus vulgaris TaxID=55149 RepID=A0A8D2JPG1_SCIVU
MEKIPKEGPALIIFYHGAIPIDFYYFMAKIFIHKGRTCRVVADDFVFKIPGFSLLLDVFCALHGPREKCVESLKSGHLLAISPGGVREALLSFALVAIDAKTKNAVQALIDKHQRTPGNNMSALLECFHKKRKINYKFIYYIYNMFVSVVLSSKVYRSCN